MSVVGDIQNPAEHGPGQPAISDTGLSRSTGQKDPKTSCPTSGILCKAKVIMNSECKITALYSIEDLINFSLHMAH